MASSNNIIILTSAEFLQLLNEARQSPADYFQDLDFFGAQDSVSCEDLLRMGNFITILYRAHDVCTHFIISVRNNIIVEMHSIYSFGAQAHICCKGLPRMTILNEAHDNNIRSVHIDAFTLSFNPSARFIFDAVDEANPGISSTLPVILPSMPDAEYREMLDDIRSGPLPQLGDVDVSGVSPPSAEQLLNDTCKLSTSRIGNIMKTHRYMLTLLLIRKDPYIVM